MTGWLIDRLIDQTGQRGWIGEGRGSDNNAVTQSAISPRYTILNRPDTIDNAMKKKKWWKNDGKTREWYKTGEFSKSVTRTVQIHPIIFLYFGISGTIFHFQRSNGSSIDSFELCNLRYNMFFSYMHTWIHSMKRDQGKRSRYTYKWLRKYWIINYKIKGGWDKVATIRRASTAPLRFLGKGGMPSLRAAVDISGNRQIDSWAPWGAVTRHEKDFLGTAWNNNPEMNAVSRNPREEIVNYGRNMKKRRRRKALFLTLVFSVHTRSCWNSYLYGE